jgi:hypothetical protein
MRGRERLRLRQRMLASGLSRAIHIHHCPLLSRPVEQATGGSKRGACQQILLRIACGEPPPRAARKRERVERWGNWLRSQRAMNGSANGASRS